jgi:hypothetical protein
MTLRDDIQLDHVSRTWLLFVDAFRTQSRWLSVACRTPKARQLSFSGTATTTLNPKSNKLVDMKLVRVS